MRQMVNLSYISSLETIAKILETASNGTLSLMLYFFGVSHLISYHFIHR